MDDLLFARCALINRHLELGDEQEARDGVIQLLDYCQSQDIAPPPVLNALTRMVGLYPYLRTGLSWDERYLLSAFSADAGSGEVVLHREQATVLRMLLDGANLALSAPTSFGKSFIVDAFISIKRPRNVLIIVPTLALADETRRRLHVKFGRRLKVITATEEEPCEAGNIFIFPQERAISYSAKMPDLDLLIVDEFYKASREFDRDRSAPLIRAILKFGAKSKQRYYLAPNIASLRESPFTEGMVFHRVDFNTVFLRKHEVYHAIQGAQAKTSALMEILQNAGGKTLVYAGTYAAIKEVATALLDQFEGQGSELLEEFHQWLVESYGPNWLLPRLMRRGVGVHNGQLHRSIGQIQIKLYEDPDGIQVLLSTSSIIEGVNTSAQNVVLWKNRNGASRLTDFEYRNIIGRSGRMFRHFVGHVFILEAPPAEQVNQLVLELPEELLGLPDVEEDYSLNVAQKGRADDFRREVSQLLGGRDADEVLRDHNVQTSDASVIKRILTDLRQNPRSWSGLSYLNSEDPKEWRFTLFRVLYLDPGAWDTTYTKFVAFTQVIAKNWVSTIPELLEELAGLDIDLDLFFKLERNVSYKLAALVGDVNTLQQAVNPGRHVDVSAFVVRAAHAFLPPTVFELEEYGLPRMISRKLQDAGVVDFEAADCRLSSAIQEIVDQRSLVREILEGFECYIFDYFLSGVMPESDANDAEH
ncbi:DEAD/DEAH box helicase [Novilysobacter defluvii]|uniref:Helicase n=1 Tax=Lysobacter defluvii IMMIB APB-9 = DSM 18482 TaxID=1385515 RepID=A0A0A0M8T0_9GAMM|nr:helicase [Lysobacter defluvii IMMIB APB-9 = DSM 18482]